MFKILLSTAGFSFLLLASCIQAQSLHDFTEQTNKIFNYAALDRMLGQVPTLIKEELQQTPGQDSPLEKKSLVILHPDHLKQDVIRFIKTNFSVDELDELVSLFEDNDYQQLSALRQQSLAASKKENLLGYHERLQNQPVNSRRKEIMKTLDELAHQSQLETLLHDKTRETIRHFSSSASSSNTPSENSSLAQYRTIQQSINFYSYRNTPNALLEAHIKRLEQPLKQRFLKGLAEALAAGIDHRLSQPFELLE